MNFSAMLGPIRSRPFRSWAFFRKRAGRPAQAWQLGFQDAATDNMTQITNFNDFLLILMTAITLVVLGLMVFVMLRFNAKANPPSKTTHNTLVEVVWTVVPISFS